MKTLSLSPNGQQMQHRVVNDAGTWAHLNGHMSLRDPGPVVAGSWVTLIFDYICGAEGMREGDLLGLAWRLPGDWGEPQSHDPTAPGFVAVNAEGAVLSVVYQDQGGVKPWNHLLVIRVVSGALDEGAGLSIVMGDRSLGSPGWASQTSSASAQEFIAMRRPAGTDRWLQLTGLPTIEIVGGPAESVEFVCPSDAVVGQGFVGILRMRDRWGNPSRGYRGRWRVSAEGLTLVSSSRLTTADGDLDVWHLHLSLANPGRHRLEVDELSVGKRVVSNPIDCHAEQPTERWFWGDLHSGQGDLGCGQGSLADYYDYARDIAGLQFLSHQANDVYVSKDEWRLTREVTRRADIPGKFLVLLGCEWTSPTVAGGDRNIVYLNDQPRLHRASRWFHETEPDTWIDAATPADLYGLLDPDAVLLNLHAGGYTSNLNQFDPRLEHLVEVHSTHGTSDWLVEDALRRGYRVGVSAGTDGIMGRPGACMPGRRQTRNLPNGCFGLISPSLARDDVWSSIQARRCYATDGQRIRLAVKAGRHWMGESIRAASSPPIDVEVAGTAAIERLVLKRGSEVVDAVTVSTFDEAHPNRYRLLWCGTRGQGTSRDQMLVWEGMLSATEGEIELVGTVGFLANEDEVRQLDERCVAWVSVTAGNTVGFEFDARLPASGKLRFRSGSLSFETALTPDGTRRFDLPSSAGSGYVTLGRAPSRLGPTDVGISLQDPSAPTGTHAYWVQVVQVDGARAWSSPIYVSIRD